MPTCKSALLLGIKIPEWRAAPGAQRLAGPPGFRRGVGGDGYDGDGQGSRFWAVGHGPLGEAPFGAPQAKKILGPKRRFTAILSDF